MVLCNLLYVDAGGCGKVKNEKSQFLSWIVFCT